MGVIIHGLFLFASSIFVLIIYLTESTKYELYQWTGRRFEISMAYIRGKW